MVRSLRLDLRGLDVACPLFALRARISDAGREIERRYDEAKALEPPLHRLLHYGSVDAPINLDLDRLRRLGAHRHAEKA